MTTNPSFEEDDTRYLAGNTGLLVDFDEGGGKEEEEEENGKNLNETRSNDEDKNVERRQIETHCHNWENERRSTSSSLSNEEEDAERERKNRRAERVLWAVAALSTFFIAAEFVGGFWAQSLAIMTDAGHMLSDLLSFIISIFAIRCARLPASKRLSFGYERAEVLGALISIIILWVLTTVLVILSVERIINKSYNVDANIMLLTAGVGVVFNIIMGLVLHFGTGGHGHTHGGGGGGGGGGGASSHGHAHGDGKNVNVRAAFIHVIGDLVQSIGVLIAALIIKFTGWEIADPICTFLFSIIVLFTTITVVRDILMVLMEATPRNFDLNNIKKALSEMDGVKGVHDLHLWSIGMDKTAFSVHLALESRDRAMETVAEARALIRQKFHINVATVQVEPFETQINSCDQCQTESA